MKFYKKIYTCFALAASISTSGLASQTKITNLADETLLQIFSQLDIQSGASVASVNHQFNDIACDNLTKYGERRAQNIDKAIESFCRAVPSSSNDMLKSQAKLIIKMTGNDPILIEAKLNAYHFLFNFSDNGKDKSQYAKKFVCLYDLHKGNIPSLRFNLVANIMKKHLGNQKSFCVLQ